MRCILIIISSLLFATCGTQSRIIYNYIEDARDTANKQDITIKEPVIQKNDLLHIQVYSISVKPEIDQMYNLPQTLGNSGSQLNGYLVDARGNIELPRIGSIHAEGLSKAELAEIVKAKLRGQLSEPSVIIRFLNFRITVLGEVGAPGVLNIPTEKLTILEALGMAGDITEYGKKKEVKILREYNGKREIGILDVTTQKMFESPYYQLQQNDIVFVEQTRYKVRQTEQERVARQIGFATGIISTVALLIALINR